MNNMVTNDSDYEDCPPRAEAMINSMRAFGYDLPMAIADLIDNSIFANAKNIKADYGWNDGNPWVRIMDDGDGMNEGSLKEAMRLGSQSPLEEREANDLGRFGLGLKTASFSQCRVLTVKTKNVHSETCLRFWDLDYVEKTKKWKIGTKTPEDAKKLLAPLDNMHKGTVVLWQNLDRIDSNIDFSGKNNENIFYEKFSAVVKYLEMVFHRYLEKAIDKIEITVGRHVCEPWDPYLRSNTLTQILSSEKYEDDRVSVIPFVLPHISNRTERESRSGSGIYGWNAHQGFYIYRNKRLIVPGGYLDFDYKPEEHYKLARIMVDITNDMDHEWNIDVRKAVAIPPDRLRNDFARIARATRQEAMKIYRARTGRARRRQLKRNDTDIWLKSRLGEKIIYKLNRDNPVLKNILEEKNLNKSWVNKLFHVIESTVPHRLIIMDSAETEDCHVDLPLDKTNPPGSMLELCKDLYDNSKARGKTHMEAVDLVTSIEPFDGHPAYRAMLDTLSGED